MDEAAKLKKVSRRLSGGNKKAGDLKMKKVLKSILCGAACIALSLPAGVNAQSQNNFISPTSDRLFYGPCVTPQPDDQEGFFGILALAIPALVRRGLQRFGGALRKAGEEKEREFTIMRVIEDSPGEAHDCIQFVRGKFYNGVPSGDKKIFNFPGPNQLEVDRLKAAGVYLAEEPEIMLEFVRQESTDGSVVSYGLGFLGYNSTLFGRLGGDGSRRKPGRDGGKGGRFLAAQISFRAPGDADDANAVGGAIEIGYVNTQDASRIMPRIGGSAGHNGFEIESEWFANINRIDGEQGQQQAGLNAEYARLASYQTLSDSQDKQGKITGFGANRSQIVLAQQEGGSPFNSAPGADGANENDESEEPAADTTPRPFNLSLKIVEFQEESKFLTFIADVFDDTSSQFESAILDEVDPARRAQALRTRLQERNEILTGFQEKFVAAEEKRLEYCSANGESDPTGTDWLALSKALWLAQLEANLEAQVVGVPIPYSKPVNVSGNAPGCYKSEDN